MFHFLGSDGPVDPNDLPEGVLEAAQQMAQKLFGGLGIGKPINQDPFLKVGELSDDEQLKIREMEAHKDEILSLKRQLEAKHMRLQASHNELWTMVEKRLGVPASVDVKLSKDMKGLYLERGEAERLGIQEFKTEASGE